MSKFAGEHLVLGKLSQLGFDAELLPKKGNNAPEIKVGNKIVQIRTRKDSRPGWVLHEKAEKLSEVNYFYIFVNLAEDGKPIFRVVPSKDVAVGVFEDHQKWLKGTPKIVTKRKDTSMRKFYDRDEIHIDAWHLLK
jgi:hypothetical protein